MARYAVYQILDGLITTVIAYNPPDPYDPGVDKALVADPNGLAEVGGTWTGTEFLPAPEGPPEEPPPPTMEERIAVIEGEWSEGGTMRVIVEAAVAAMPSKATNAPPAVAGASSLGDVEIRYARENHTHEINAAQNSAISSNQSAISALQTLTGGLNTPAAPNAIPPDIAGTGAAGVSDRYARMDHTHKGVLVSGTAATALAAAAAAGTSADAARVDHVHPLPAVVASTGTSRALETAWTPSATKATLVVATVRISVTSTISGASEAAVELRSDSASTPTTNRCRAQNRNAVSLAIALQVVDEKTFTLVHLVPAGDKVLLTKSVNAGTNTCTLERVTETVIG